MRAQSIQVFHRQHLLPKNLAELPRRLVRNLLKSGSAHSPPELSRSRLVTG